MSRDVNEGITQTSLLDNKLQEHWYTGALNVRLGAVEDEAREIANL